jgi:membrane associated rhomboid family serine protease
MFFPYRDDNPRILIPYVTYAILAVNVLIFIYQALLIEPGNSQAFTLRFGMIPAYVWGTNAQMILDFNREILSQYYPTLAANIGDIKLLPPLATLVTSPFLHGGWMHILGNMLFLYVFADNVEGALGHVQFALFYLISALAAGLLHLVIFPGSMVPVVGASGAISGVLGGYILRYPRARIHVLIFIVIFFTTIRLPAVFVLGYWFLIQTINGLVSLQIQMSGGVAWFEHIGGFLAGFSYMAIFGRRRKLNPKYE